MLFLHVGSGSRSDSVQGRTFPNKNGTRSISAVDFRQPEEMGRREHQVGLRA